MRPGRDRPLASAAKFSERLWWSVLLAAIVVIAAIAIGMVGIMYFENKLWPDAFVWSAMILSGMGPIGDFSSFGGKMFAGVYAIFCGLLIFGVAGLILAPIFHRILHRFHVDDDDAQN